MIATKNPIAEYLEMTGQSMQDLFAGAGQYGAEFVKNLAEQAVKNHQKIVWYNDPEKDPTLGLLRYRFQRL